MAEIKRGYSQGDFEAQEEAKLLEGLSWKSWKQTLEHHLENEGLIFPNGDNEKLLHQWFVLRHLRKLGKVSQDEFDQEKKELFSEKNEVFGNKSMAFAISFINSKTEKVRT